MNEDVFLLRFQGVFSIPEDEDSYLISLTDQTEMRALSILTNKNMAYQLRDWNNHDPKSKQRLPYVLTSLLKSYTAVSESYLIRLRGAKEEGFEAYVVNKLNDDVVAINPDEAILLALVSDMNIVTNISTMKHYSTPVQPERMQVALPLQILPDKLLHHALDKAVKSENYEMASFLRDEINRRKELASNRHDEPNL